jgi:serine/threonine protein kinase
MDDLSGRQFGSYRVTQSLGQGGKVYLGEHLYLGTQVAIKIWSSRLNEPGEREEYLRETKLLARLHHPNIVKALDFAIEGGIPYLVMEHAPNGSLHHRLPRRTPIPLETIRPYVRQIADALQYLHEQKVLHRNIKPANILLNKDEKAVLSSFGLAIPVEDAEHEQGAAVEGTPTYMAPEVFQGKVSQASDQYALAVMIYEWLAGHSPFSRSGILEMSKQKLSGPLTSLRASVPSLPKTVETVILTALKQDPRERFASVRAFANAFEQACRGQEAQPVPQPPPDHAVEDYQAGEQHNKLPLAEGQQLGAYHLTTLLDRHPFGEVYLGRHTQQGTQVIIKGLNAPMTGANEDLFRERLRPLAALNHPRLLRVLDVQVEQGTAFVVTEFAPQGAVSRQLPAGETLQPSTILSYIKQIIEALEQLSSAGIAPQPFIKPSQLFFASNAALQLDVTNDLLDSLWREMTHPVQILSDLRYMAPEWLASRMVQHPGYQYLLGLLVYEWATGSFPFRGSTGRQMLNSEIINEHQHVLPAPLRKKARDLSPAIEGVVLTALEKQPEYRFVNTRAFAEALERAILPRKKGKRPDLTGQQLGNYTLVRLLGQGAFGSVYLGEHIRLGMQAAIKVLRERPGEDELQKFLAEGRRLAGLHHPNILRVLEFDEERETPYLIIDYAPNGTLRDRHPRGVRLAPAAVAAYIKQVAAALQHTHDARLMHLDIKPENLLLGHRREIVIGDFGLSIMLQGSKTHLTLRGFSGTPVYAAPEQFEQRPGHASDQYALGITAYEWLTGKVPFYGEWWAIGSQKLAQPPTPLRAFVRDLSPALEQVILKALAKEPAERYPSVLDFAAALEAAALAS